MYIKELARRSLLVYLRATPTPQTLRESLALHTLLTEQIGGDGALIQYRQSICPVTKVRMPKIRALIEDYGRGGLKQEHIVWPGAPLPQELSVLERRLLDIGGGISVSAMTRDAEQIERVRRAAAGTEEDAEREGHIYS